MKRENRFRNRILQFGYEHRVLGQELQKIQKSVGEVEKMLDGMAPEAGKEKGKKGEK